MEYPFLHWTAWGGGLLIALVATIHVFIAHFAVGGGLFIAIMETRVQRHGLVSHKDYLRHYAKFFLHLTMVVGGLTGVGIWFTISITAPGATSALIHGFVLGWATEWTFFLAEIVALLAYMRSFEGMRSTRRLILAWLYFVFAFGSLAVVQGLISLMLTPGEWLETRSFWDGFFNPTYFPGLLFRSAIAASIAGVFGLMTVQGFGKDVPDEGERKRLTRFCSLWTILPLPVIVAAGWWHIAVLSPEQQLLALGRSPEMAAGMRVFWWAGPAVLAGGALLTARLPRRAARAVAMVTLAASFLFLGSYEYMREAARRPYLITGYIYSNGILVADAEKLNETGILSQARWVKHKTVTPENRLEAGRELFFLQCASCHSQGGPMLDILPRSARYSTAGMEALLTGLGKVSTYMPPFFGTAAEKSALAAWLTVGLHKTPPPAAVDIVQTDEPVPAFAEDAEFMLTAAADHGVQMLFDSASIDFGHPAQGLTAQLLRRDASPSLVTEQVALTWRLEDRPEVGGPMTLDGRAFRAEGLPVSPYTSAKAFQPYPVALIQAHDEAGTLLAETKVVLPVSSEIGCWNCHGGAWSQGVAGLSEATAQDILRSHDRMNRTDLVRRSSRGERIACRSCHLDADAPGKTVPNLSAAMHGLHAVYLAGRGADACNMCHPTDPKGATRAFRDPHDDAGLDCTACHGSMEDNALGLIAREQAQGVTGLDRLAARIVPSRDDIPPRQPWINMPACQTCHTDLGDPEHAEAFGVWTADAGERFKARKDELDAVFCSGCHGAMHGVYPARNPYGDTRDNLQPLQYQQAARPLGAGGNCKACHTMDMDTPVHHPGMGLE
ncbi:cytochrome c family protein [Megalodesulfovibrio gigas]|uniref:Cytochrome c family protein n=1 Tax=Megalodesulfovibrio gigas (strain ATCC 19364 / DSM 1382 / NCIMB 9332 / VKM B-1759) TaxID=1121448 RepID=T2GG11_MEGG1|nr:cytochrome c family protein [Megalodesulfovibrio gigas]AGW15263.1 cytochrome c family protein [Megalodesulfovibrio gigas DSM 1382 = ATCC 19364]